MKTCVSKALHMHRGLELNHSRMTNSNRTRQRESAFPLHSCDSIHFSVLISVLAACIMEFYTFSDFDDDFKSLLISEKCVSCKIFYNFESK